MFTGLIQHVGRVRALVNRAAGASLSIDPAGWSHAPEPGESIAINGCCLTLAAAPEFAGGLLSFDVVHQTLRNTTLGGLATGDRVNLEHAATPSTLLGGHIVQGHIDGVGVVAAAESGRDEHRLRITPPPDLMEFMVDRGSIAVDGVSLTIAAVAADSFEVALIPTTLDMTTLSALGEGSRVNLEVDCLAKLVVSWLKRQRASPG
jgi:riboflavin synthase